MATLKHDLDTPLILDGAQPVRKKQRPETPLAQGGALPIGKRSGYGAQVSKSWRSSTSTPLSVPNDHCAPTLSDGISTPGLPVTFQSSDISQPSQSSHQKALAYDVCFGMVSPYYFFSFLLDLNIVS